MPDITGFNYSAITSNPNWANTFGTTQSAATTNKKTTTQNTAQSFQVSVLDVDIDGPKMSYAEYKAKVGASGVGYNFGNNANGFVSMPWGGYLNLSNVYSNLPQYEDQVKKSYETYLSNYDSAVAARQKKLDDEKAVIKAKVKPTVTDLEKELDDKPVSKATTKTTGITASKTGITQRKYGTMPDPSDSEIQVKRRKAAATRMMAKGRASTILTEDPKRKYG